MRPLREESVFDEAVEISDPAERSRFLDRACAGDATLRAAVEELLHWHDAAPGFLARPAVTPSAGPADAADRPASGPGGFEPLLGEIIEGVTLVRHLGEGACGAVYEGEQRHPRRRVAVKVLGAASATTSSITRFLREADILAGLDHPGIARVYASGTARLEGGMRPCFVMELVEEAGPITSAPACRDAPLQEKLRLFREVCDAVAHAHRQGIVHRDLKPANILVDGMGRPKVIDFGWARLVGEGAGAAGERTLVGQLVGTLAYMSPEQFDGDPSAIDARADVWALGVVLQEILVGRRPFDFTGRTVYEAATVVRSVEPVPLTRLDRRLPRDLGVIVATCLEKARERRYADAGALADDLGRLLAGQPIRACPPGFADGVRLLARRHRVAAGAVALAAGALVAALVGIGLFAARAERARVSESEAVEVARGERDRAAREARAAKRTLYQARVQRLSGLPSTAAPDERASLSASTAALAAELGLTTSSGEMPLELAILRASLDAPTLATWREPAAIDAMESSPDGTTLALGCADGVVRLRGAAGDGPRLDLRGHSGMITRLAFDPGGSRLASAAADGTARVWDPVTGAEVARLAAHSKQVEDVAFDPSGERVATASRDWKACLWDAATASKDHVLRDHPWMVGAARFDPVDGRLLATVSFDGTSVLWDAASASRLGRWGGRRTRRPAVAFSPDARRLAIASPEGGVDLVDTASRQRVAHLPGSVKGITGIDFSPDGTRLVFVADDESVQLWDTVAPIRLAFLSGHRRRISAARFSPDGSRVATASWDRVVRVWDSSDGRLVAELAGHETPVLCLAWARDGRSLSTGSRDGEVRVWDLLGSRVMLRGLSAAVGAIAFSGDGSSLSGVSSDGTSRTWRTADGAVENGHDGPDTKATATALSADGLFVALGRRDGRVAIRPLDGGAEPAACDDPFPASVVGVSFSADGRRLLGFDDRDTVRVADMSDGRVLAEIHPAIPRIVSGAFDSEGARVVVGGASGEIAVWREGAGAPKAAGPLGGRVRLLSWRPWRDHFVATADSGEVVLFDGADAIPLQQAPAFLGKPTAIAFSLDGARLLIGGEQGQLAAWDVDGGRPLLAFVGHEQRINAAAWSPDGTRVATASDDRTVRLWDAADGVCLLVLEGHEGKVLSTAFSPDGRLLASSSADGAVRLWGQIRPPAGGQESPNDP